MPKLNIVVEHRLEEHEALVRVKRLLTETKNGYGDKVRDLRESWEGNTGTFSFSVIGFAVSGTLKIEQNRVVLDGNLPWGALIFKAQVEGTIRERATALLA